MKTMPKSAERIEQDDFCSNSRGVITIRFNPQALCVKIRGSEFLLDEAPSLIVRGRKMAVIAIA